MAVSTTNAYDGPYVANGVTVAFPFTFTAPSAAEVAVYLIDEDGVQTVADPDDYTVVVDGGGGGTVTFDTAPDDTDVVILLDPDFTQDIEFENGSAWLASPVNEANDRGALRDQVLKREVDRAFLASLGSSGFTLPHPAALIGSRWVLGTDETTGLPTLINTDSLSSVPGPAGSVAAYSDELLSSSPGGALGSRFRATLGDIIDGNGENNRADLRVNRVRSAWAASHVSPGVPAYNYYDETASITVNQDGSGNLINPQNSGLGIFWEPKFFQNVFAFEWQFRFTGRDGVQRRPFQLFLPEAGLTRGVASGTFQLDKIDIVDWLSVIYCQADIQTGVTNWGVNVVHNYNRPTGNPVHKQYDAGTVAFLNMPFITTERFLYQEQPSFIQGSARSNAAFGITAFHVGQCLSLPVGGYLDFVVSQSATAGTVNGIVRDVNATGTMTNRIENTGGGATVFNVKGSTASGYQVNDTKVLGARQTAVGDATNAAGVPTQAEFNALVAKFNLLLDKIGASGHGLTADA